MVDLEMLESDWLRPFQPLSQEQDFSQIYDLCRNRGNKTNFHHWTNSVKIIEQIQWKLLNKFSLNSKNPVIGLFPQFWGQKKFFQKIRLCHAQHKGFYHHAKIWRNLMIQFQENIWADSRNWRIDRPYFIGPFWLPPGGPTSTAAVE